MYVETGTCAAVSFLIVKQNIGEFLSPHTEGLFVCH